MHYDVVSNSVLWFLFHDLFDRIRRPRFDHGPTSVGGLPGGERGVHRRDGAGCSRQRRRPRERLPTVARRAASAGAATGSAYRAFHAHPILWAGRHPRPSVVCGAGSVFGSGVRTGRFFTARWARAYHQSARRVGPRPATIAPTFAASLGVDVAALDEVAAGADTRTASTRSTTRSVTASSSHGATGSNRRRTSCAGSSPTTGCWRADPACAAGSCSSRCCTRRDKHFLNTLPTPARSNRSCPASTTVGRHQIGCRSSSTNVTTSHVRSPRYQRYDVLLVNPIKDGLNLVAKEGPAVNRRDGLLCLSRASRRV